MDSLWARLTVAILAVVFLWFFRINTAGPDSIIFIGAKEHGHIFIFPEVGATWLIFQALDWAEILSVTRIDALRGIVCLLGGIFTYLALELGRSLLGGHLRGVLVVALLFSAGFARLYAGHIEVYGFLLVPTILYVLLAIRYLHTGQGWIALCFALGVAGWTHAAAALLIPSVVVLPRLFSRDITRAQWIRLLVIGGVAALLPFVFFLLSILLGAGSEGLTEPWTRLLEIIGAGGENAERRWWVRVWDRTPDIGTDYALFSVSQFKYLANAFFLMAPTALLSILGLALLGSNQRSPRSKELRFLTWIAVPTVAYCFALRAFWGPFDWDLFSITALMLVITQARILSERIASPVTLRHAAICIVAFQLYAVGVPFLMLDRRPAIDAGPFAEQGNYLHTDLLETQTSPPDAIAPWL